MGRRLWIFLQLVFCAVAVVLAVLGSKGSVSPLLGELSQPSHELIFARRTVLSLHDDMDTKLHPSEMLAPSTLSLGPVNIGFDVPLPPAKSSALPPNTESASSPSNGGKAQSVLPPSILSANTGFDVPPSSAIPSALPPNKAKASSPADVVKSQSSLGPSPLDPDTGSIAHPPSISLPKFEDSSPPIQPFVPPAAQHIAPSDHASMEHNQPASISPSIEIQGPNAPRGAVDDISPSFVNPPLAQIRKPMLKDGIHAKAPSNNASVSSSHPPAPSPPDQFQLSPPIVPPISPAASASTNQQPPHAENLESPAASPPLDSSPVIHQKSPGVPIAAPPSGLTQHVSPVNHSRIKGLSPVLSPLPHETGKPSNGRQSPPLPHSDPPKGEVVPDLAPAPIVSTHEGNSSEKVGHHASAPKGEMLHNPAPAPPVPTHHGNASDITGRNASTPKQETPQSPAPAPPVSNHQGNASERVGHHASTPKGETLHSPAPAPTVPTRQGNASERGRHASARKREILHSPAPAPPVSNHQRNASKRAGHHASPLKGQIPHSPEPAPSVTTNQRNSSRRAGHNAVPPSSLAPLTPSSHTSAEKIHHSSAPAPILPIHHRGVRKRVGNMASAPSPTVSSPSSNSGPAISLSPLHPPEVSPKDRQKHHPPTPLVQVLGPSLSPRQDHHSSGDSERAPTPSPSPVISSGWDARPKHSPVSSPSGLFPRKPMTPHRQPILALPPPPPDLDCTPLTCTGPLTNSPPGSPCLCVLPIRVGLRLSVALYTFFPSVSELAQEVASGIFMKQSQVRIMGANAASEEPEKTVVLIDLVPLGGSFDYTTASLTYQRFWHKQVDIKSSYFGDYDVLYVLYPGLPPSPPVAPANINAEDGTFGNGNNARAIKPLGVDVRKKKDNLNGSLIAIIVLSSIIALVICVGAAWLLLMKYRHHTQPTGPTPQAQLPSFAKSAGTGPTIPRSHPSSASGSFGSSIATYAGSAKTFSLAEIERAINRFDDLRIIGEGGFGRVYQGTLEDGTQVAVKVLKRDDQQGGREFLAEVEMLSRLHHRNLVKLIGICTEEHLRSLVYELIPNGSVESHLHGVDKDMAPLDWNARMKIALGAARGLAYLHEDSSPRVIHRDFKSSNILLEHDFTPKVSDFGLARTALDEGNEHISTRVMGTFGYVAPEYAMTGHLLVKSDVYSYGVVLLELLTGRKPVDMSQPPGQENLVTWTRPLLTSREGLEMIIDPALGTETPFDSVAKVAAIASMCVQPEVSHRPFMGEVVQALKLVYNEGDENVASESCSQEVLSAHGSELRISTGIDLEPERELSASDMFSTSARFSQEPSGSFRRHSSSGPLRPGGGRNFWQKVQGLPTGSMSDHVVALKYAIGLDGKSRWQ